ncbi:MAG: L-ribulose-5-phosphate 4-epimerase AraD [Candidatus Limnocylindrales bacterium]
MSIAEQRELVAEANRELALAGLVTLSFGNASGVDRAAGLMVIKPSGVPCREVQAADLVVVALDDGRVVEGTLRPSSDTPTHLVLYRRFPGIGGVVHTHSSMASAWAQAERSIPCFGTTHADHFHGPVPVTRRLTAAEIQGDYEHETGCVIAETFETLGLDPLEAPGALVASHGPFTWGADAAGAVTNAIALEAIAAMALRTIELRPGAEPIARELLERHFQRKHGPAAYYGQAEQRG